VSNRGFPDYAANPEQTGAEKNAMAHPEEGSLSTPEDGAMARLVHAPWDATDSVTAGNAMTGTTKTVYPPNSPNKNAPSRGE
jgi:hypothetical protein